MAAARRRRSKPKKFVRILEGEVTADEADGVVLWDFIPPDTDRGTPAHGYHAGGLLDAVLAGKRVRITIEEL